MISDITAVPEVGKTYLGKVVRLAEFGAFVEIFPGTDGLLHVSEIAEHRVKEVKDELREGDQILVKVIALEGNRIKLSRKAVLKEQRAKLGLPDPEQAPASDEPRRERAPRPERGSRYERPERPEPPKAEETVVVEGGDDFEDDEDFDDEGGEEVEVTAGAPAETGAASQGGAPGGQQRRGRRRRGRRPGGPGAPPSGNGGGAS
jgi:polyribonucleotide nucleotidyltransferase